MSLAIVGLLVTVTRGMPFDSMSLRKYFLE